MRERPDEAEWRRLLRPVAAIADAAWGRMHWAVAAAAALYAVSGITVVRSDEVAVVLRWGRVTGNNPAEQLHAPGLLFALPRPIDEVVRVQTRRVLELKIDTLAATGATRLATIDPIATGYSLTGDQNIVHLNVIARYQVSDPVAWLYEAPDAESILRTEVTAALVRTIGELPVDSVLSDGRKQLVATATARAQQGLDAARSGLQLSSVEVTSLGPPSAVSKEFDDVQSAYIKAETDREQALAYREAEVPKAQSEAATGIQAAEAEAAQARAVARGDADAFAALAAEARANPRVVRERLYRDAIEAAISGSGSVKWVPPPGGARYTELRITLAGKPPAIPPMPKTVDE